MKYCEVCRLSVADSCISYYHQSRLPNGQVFTGSVCSDCRNEWCGSCVSCNCRMVSNLYNSFIKILLILLSVYLI